MEDGADGQVEAGERLRGAVGGEAPDAHHGARPERLHSVAQGAVAGREERGALGRRQAVRRAVAAALFEEGERAVVEDEEAAEELLRCAEAVARPAPQPRAGDLAARAAEAQHRARRMLARGAPDGPLDPQPVADHRHVAEGDTGLRHAERPGVHADEGDALLSARGRRAPPLEVAAVGLPGVVERLVDVADRRPEAQRSERVAKAFGDGDERRRRAALSARRRQGLTTIRNASTSTMSALTSERMPGSRSASASSRRGTASSERTACSAARFWRSSAGVTAKRVERNIIRYSSAAAITQISPKRKPPAVTR